MPIWTIFVTALDVLSVIMNSGRTHVYILGHKETQSELSMITLKPSSAVTKIVQIGMLFHSVCDICDFGLENL